MSKTIFKTIFSPLNFLIFLMIVIGPGTGYAEKITEETKQKLKGLRIPFIPNQGQMDQQVKFYVRTFSGTVYVTEKGWVVYELPAANDRKDRRWALVEEPLAGLPINEIRGEGESETKVNYFTGNDPAQWKSGLSTYNTIDLGEVYKGIRLKLRAHGGSVEKLYYLSPGREPKEIQIEVKGADSLKVNDKGELEVQTGNGPVTFSRPRAFQTEVNMQQDVDIAYVVNGNSYGFKVGSYDVTKELIIDPLLQATYLGGTNFDRARSITVSGGNVYVAGETQSTDFPGTAGGVLPASRGNGDAFAALLSADLKTLIQATYLGGGIGDYATSLAVSGDSVYVAGYTTSTDFPGTAGGAQPAASGGIADAFVALLSADLKTLVQSTYLGGQGDDRANSLAVSGANIYAAGYTASTDFPGTAGGAQPSNGGKLLPMDGRDAFMALLSPDLKTLVQSTYLGGQGDDQANSLAVSGANIYAAATTDWKFLDGSVIVSYSTVTVALLSADLKNLIQSTPLTGGGGVFLGRHDAAASLAVSGGNVYVAGSTRSNSFPGTAGGAQPVSGGGADAFAALLSADLNTLIQSTFLGGSNDDFALSLALSGGSVYVFGGTGSINFPGTAGGAQSAPGGGADAFVTLLSGDLKTLIQSTYLGGRAFEHGYALTASGGNVYGVGETQSTDFPGTAGGAQPEALTSPAGTWNAFVALLSGDLKGGPSQVYFPSVIKP